MNDLLSVSANSIQFGFITEQIQAEAFTWQSQIDFITKCYNLFLLFFYFQIMKFVIQTIVHVFSKTR